MPVHSILKQATACACPVHPPCIAQKQCSATPLMSTHYNQDRQQSAPVCHCLHASAKTSHSLPFECSHNTSTPSKQLRCDAPSQLVLVRRCLHAFVQKMSAHNILKQATVCACPLLRATLCKSMSAPCPRCQHTIIEIATDCTRLLLPENIA